mmetsp:Transcript_11280/g.25713  ORF Transcript_11280/g.25713 Transcript_11280/m.25713 type:complete len:880 (+) Transcript_11280:259-2898(+)
MKRRRRGAIVLPLLVAATLVLVGGSATRRLNRKRPRLEGDALEDGEDGARRSGRKGTESPTRLLTSNVGELIEARELKKRRENDRGRAKRKRKQNLSRIRGSATKKRNVTRKKKKQTSYKKQKKGWGKSGKKTKKWSKSSKKRGRGADRPSNQGGGGGGGNTPENNCGRRHGTCFDRADYRPGEAPKCDRLVAGIAPSTERGERLISGTLTLELLDPAGGNKLGCPASRSMEASLLTYLADNIGTNEDARSEALDYQPVCVSVVDHASAQPRDAEYEVLGVEVEITYVVDQSNDDRRRLLDELGHSEVGSGLGLFDGEVEKPPRFEREPRLDSRPDSSSSVAVEEIIAFASAAIRDHGNYGTAGRELQLKSRQQQGSQNSRGRQCTPLQTAMCCSQLVLNGRANLGRSCQDLGCNFISSCGSGRVAEQDNNWKLNSGGKRARKRGGKRIGDDWSSDKKKTDRSDDKWRGSRRTLEETTYLDLETDELRPYGTESNDGPSTNGVRRRLASCPDYTSRTSQPSWYDNLSSTAYNNRRGVGPSASSDDDPYYCPAYGLLHDENLADYVLGCLTPLDPLHVTAQLGVELRPATACASNRVSIQEGGGPVLRCDAFERLGCDYSNDDLLPDVERTAERRRVAYCVDEPTHSPTLTPTLSPSQSPTISPSLSPTMNPTMFPTMNPSYSPTVPPTHMPTMYPTVTRLPTEAPTTGGPTFLPSPFPTATPTRSPSSYPSEAPSIAGTGVPSAAPSEAPIGPTEAPTFTPTDHPTFLPTLSPTFNPSMFPTLSPTASPSSDPTKNPTMIPTETPTSFPTIVPTETPTDYPTTDPTSFPTGTPTETPTSYPTLYPTITPTKSPTFSPSLAPTLFPTVTPVFEPTESPTS